MYHWIMTLTWQSGARQFTGTGHGTAPVAGKSRAEIYEQVLAHSKREMSAPAAAAVMFFSLEPDALPQFGSEQI